MAQTGKMTLLDIVQEILSSMDSDQVNSINDTFESEQVASIVRGVFRDMVSNRNWAGQKRPVNIDSYGDNTYPTHMVVQEEIKELCFVNYNIAGEGETRRKYQRMRWIEPDDFLRKANNLNTDATNVDVVIDPSGIEIAIRNDTEPRYYTSFDDATLVFDAYDSAVDDTLQASKTQATAYLMPQWEQTDTFQPDLPLEALSALVAEAKSVAHIELKQQANDKAEQVSRRQQSWLSRKERRIAGGIRYPDYGRAGKKGSSQYSTPFDKSSYIDKV